MDHIESDIIFGRLRPNQGLIEDALMTRFEAKRHVVRPALRELTVRRLVTKPRSRSARVKDFTAQEVQWLLQANQDHAAMIAAIEHQDRGALETLVVEHMQPIRRLWKARHGEPISHD